jgi:hypothetical protein
VLNALGEVGYDGWATSGVSGPPPAAAGKLWVNSGEAELADMAARMKRVLGVGSRVSPALGLTGRTQFDRSSLSSTPPMTQDRSLTLCFALLWTLPGFARIMGIRIKGRI